MILECKFLDENALIDRDVCEESPKFNFCKTNENNQNKGSEYCLEGIYT